MLENYTRTTKILMAVAVLFLVALGIFFLIRKSPTPQEGEQLNAPTPPGASTTTPSIPTPTPPPPATPPPVVTNPDDTYVRQIARDFVERFSSYSNQNKNTHITDVLPLVTDSMALWIKTQDKEQSSVYEGVTTKVMVNTLVSKTDTQANVHVEVQQHLQTSTGQEIVYRSGTVDLVKQGNMWKVDGLFWK